VWPRFYLGWFATLKIEAKLLYGSVLIIIIDYRKQSAYVFSVPLQLLSKRETFDPLAIPFQTHSSMVSTLPRRFVVRLPDVSLNCSLP
jgi:hypothetical protein